MHPTNIAASRIVTTIAMAVTYSNPYKTGDNELIAAIPEMHIIDMFRPRLYLNQLIVIRIISTQVRAAAINGPKFA